MGYQEVRQMPEQKDNYWFYVKRFGWGWGLPARWQGWVVFAAYAASLFGSRYFFHTFRYRLVFIIAITVLLIAIVAWKGERPLKWRWGRK